MSNALNFIIERRTKGNKNSKAPKYLTKFEHFLIMNYFRIEKFEIARG
jgi:hypothetical protein